MAMAGEAQRDRDLLLHIKRYCDDALDAALPLIHVAACARDAENAQELCDLFSADIKRLLQNSFEG